MRRLIKKAFNPIRIFLNDSRATGVILLCCTVISICLSNFPFSGETYKNLWHKEFLHTSFFIIPGSFSHWINDFLMAFFFLLAGMEIKRELITGELSSVKRAVLPFGAALGGMIVPACIFLLFNAGSSYAHGWGIPTATDIAFSLGVASLFGKKIPVGLKILLMALAIIDDLGAIIVIALFYGGQIRWIFLAISALLYVFLWVCNIRKVKFGFIQIVLSVLLWFCILNSGIEGSITGVLVAFALPINMLPKIEKAIHGYVNFFIIPSFALANTAILMPGNIIESLSSTISIGVIAGLVIGKPLGIFLFSRLMILFKIAHLPHNVTWKHLFGMGTLAGIGFTMSIFTTNLAFDMEISKDISKISILISMILSLAISWMYFKLIDIKIQVVPEKRVFKFPQKEFDTEVPVIA
ncbi:MAG: Na+/H+ antiporter NhaA [Sphingobacteriales bacterium]|nr:Na+/H+ antiporter NhaA [Sphingobacteriales bacterium]